MKKIDCLLLTIVISLMILWYTVIDFITPDRLYSESENRILALKPEFSWSELRSGKLMSDYETYITDQFAYRDIMISIKTRSDILLGKKDIRGVYLAKDGSLMEQHTKEEFDEETIEKRINLLKTLLSECDGKDEINQISVMLIPTADYIKSDKLPLYAEYFDQEAFINRVKNEIGSRYVVDVMSSLLLHKDEYIYYKTDHHWTTLGAYYGYQCFAQHMGFDIVDYDNHIEIVAEDFLGTLHSKINIKKSPDRIEAYRPDKKDYKVYYDFSEDYKASLYEEKHLKTKNKYGYFLDDNHAFVSIQSEQKESAELENVKNKDQKALFILKDSYANCFVPFAAEHYENVYVIDLRYYRSNLSALIDDCSFQKNLDILILYNVPHFINEFQYY